MIHAPKIYFHDPAAGLIWMEISGARSWSYRAESWLVRRAFYESRLRKWLIASRFRAAAQAIAAPSPHSSTPRLSWEQHYFFDNCLGRHFGLGKEQLKSWRHCRRWGQSRATGGFPARAVHRDFQSQNIIIRRRQAHLIDFQGMRPGWRIRSRLARYDPYARLRARSERIARALSPRSRR